MADINELNLDEMSKVSGGTMRTVNTGVVGLNAALRAEPKKDSKQIGSLENNSKVDVNDSTLTYDSGSHRNYVYVTAGGKSGWVAASIVGLPR